MKHLLIAVLVCALNLSLLYPAMAAQEIHSHFIELSPQEQAKQVRLRQLYKQVSERWFQERLDPTVDANGIRSLLNASSEALQQLESNSGDNDKKPEKPDAEQQKTLQDKIYKNLVQAQIQLMPSRQVEMRGALLDAGLLPQTEAGMKWYLHRLKEAGFNAVFPEVFKRGYALFPNPIIELDPSLQASQTDLLKMLTKAAQKEGLEVYPWFWMFRVLSPTVSRQNPLVRRLPALMSRPLDGEAYQSNNAEIEDESSAFFSPAAQEWQELLTALMQYTSEKYPIQGFMMDYIRYGNKQTEDELSLTHFQLDYFKRVGEFPPPRINPSSKLQASWHLWREEQVHTMVRNLRRVFANQKTDLGMGAAVFRNEVQARNTKMQHWRHWSNNHWVDYIAPMMYTSDFKDLDLWMDWETDQGTRYDMLYPIIGGHKIQQNRIELLNQISLLQERHANGITIFSMRNLNDDMLKDLAEGPFRLPASIPHTHLPNALSKQLGLTSNWLLGLDKRGQKTEALGTSSRQVLQVLARESKRAADTLANQSARKPRISGKQAIGIVKGLLEQAQDTTRAFPQALRKRLLQYFEDALKLAQIYAVQADISADGYHAPSRPPSEVSPEARPIPELTIPVAATAPKIDALVDDEAWKKAVIIPQLFKSTGSGLATTPTEIRITYDEQALYIAYINDEPRTDRMKVSFRQHTELLNEDDTVQIFLNPTDNSPHYYYFVVNAANQRFQKASFDRSWSRPWTSMTRSFSHGWISEIAIPFASLNLSAPGNNKSWQGNFCRRRPQEINDFQCWSFTFGGIHRTDRFGKLKFAPLPQKEPTPKPSQEACMRNCQ